MSVAEVHGRISEIQSQFALLGFARSASVQAASGAAFATSLSQAQGVGAATATSFAVTGSAAGAGAGSVEGGDVVAEARKYLGLPYVWGGTDPKKGLDCSGLVQLVYKNLGVDLPRVSYQQAKVGTAVTGGLAAAKPGDILAFNSPVNHVGIYIGDGKMIEAPRTGLDVRVIDVYEKPTAIRRVLPDSGVAAASMASPSSTVPGTTPYADLFRAASAKHGVSSELLVAVAKQESRFNPRAVSHAGAQGIMQLMPATARGLGVADPFDPAQAINGAAKLLKSHLREFGSTELALAAYNAGPGAVKRYDGVPPYNETQNYVRRIMADLRNDR